MKTYFSPFSLLLVYSVTLVFTDNKLQKLHVCDPRF